ncbi:MAG: hypothetical protein ACLFS0_09825 [Bacteroidales bacterium]
MYRIKEQTIKSLEGIVTKGINELGESYQAVQLLPELQKDYPGQLKKEVASVRFYQTGKACYLETTIDEDMENDRTVEADKDSYHPYETYSRVDYRIHRTSLAFIWGLHEDKEGPVFHPKKPILDNAVEFLCGMDPLSMINCTNIFTRKAEEEISNEADESGKYTPCGMLLKGESLKEMDGYNSNYDPDFPETPMMQLLVMDGRLLLSVEQPKNCILSESQTSVGSLPDYIRFQSYTEEDIPKMLFSIPCEQVKGVFTESAKEVYADYNVPDRYTCVVDLASGEQLTVTGEFGETYSESCMPESWYYDHTVKVETKLTKPSKKPGLDPPNPDDDDYEIITID